MSYTFTLDSIEEVQQLINRLAMSDPLIQKISQQVAQQGNQHGSSNTNGSAANASETYEQSRARVEAIAQGSTGNQGHIPGYEPRAKS